MMLHMTMTKLSHIGHSHTNAVTSHSYIIIWNMEYYGRFFYIWSFRVG